MVTYFIDDLLFNVNKLDRSLISKPAGNRTRNALKSILKRSVITHELEAAFMRHPCSNEVECNDMIKSFYELVINPNLMLRDASWTSQLFDAAANVKDMKAADDIWRYITWQKPIHCQNSGQPAHHLYYKYMRVIRTVISTLNPRYHDYIMKLYGKAMTILVEWTSKYLTKRIPRSPLPWIDCAVFLEMIRMIIEIPGNVMHRDIKNAQIQMLCLQMVSMNLIIVGQEYQHDQIVVFMTEGAASEQKTQLLKQVADYIFLYMTRHSKDNDAKSDVATG